MRTTTHDAAAAETRLGRPLLALLAVAVGAAVANRFYIEPLLSLVAETFGVSTTVAGLLVTAANLGYVVGLALLAPLGDMLERRRLIMVLMLAAGGAATACAAAPGLPTLAVALAALALLSVCAQVLIPLAASLAGPGDRGHVVGIVTSGLLVGTLTARAVSGLAAGIGGFRLVFALAAALMILLALLLRRYVPVSPPNGRHSYRRLLGSVLSLVAGEPVLRQRMALAFLQFAGFMTLWTPSAFLLANAPYHYGTTIIGLFGFIGIAGALAAPLAGRLGDRQHGRLAVTVALTTCLISWIPIALGSSSLIALIAGIALLDAGFQGAHINHQRIVFALRPDARNRLNTAYMLAFFLGGVVGSTLATIVYSAGGWTANCVLGAGLAAGALAIWSATQRAHRTAGTAQA